MSTISRRSFVTGGISLAAGLAASAASVAALPGSALAGSDGETVYSNARILLGIMPSEGATELSGGVRIVNGMITEVGPGVTGGIDLAGATIWPGVWDAGSTIGLADIDLEGATRDDAETGDAFLPQMRVVDAFNPASEVLPVLRARGVMGALVVPGGGIVGGQAAWMRTNGSTVAAATVLEPAGLVIHLGRAGVGAGAATRMGVAARLRDALDANPPPKTLGADEPHATGKKATSARHKAPEAPIKPPTRAESVWHDLHSRKLRAIFVADRASDVLLACEIANEYGLDAVVLGAAEGWMVADALSSANMPVIVGPVTVQPESFETLNARYDNAALLHAAGVRIGLRIGDPHRAYDLTTEAGIAVAWGLPREVAIAAICGNSLAFFGLGAGRLLVGKEASFVVSNGDPLEPRTAVQRVIIGGSEVALTNHQTELYERFKVLK